MTVLKTAYLPSLAPTMRQTFNVTSDGEAVVQQTNDVSGILRANHFDRTTQTLHHQGQAFNHYARIDVLAIKNWCAQRGIVKGWWRRFNEDDSLWKAFLNDPENEVWRTRKGKV